MEIKLVTQEADSEFVGKLRGLENEFLLKMLNASPDCIKIVDTDGSLVFMNHNGQCAMEIDNFDTIQGAAWCTLWPEELQDQIDEAVILAARGKSSRFEAFCPTAKGTPRWWEVTVTPVHRDDRTVDKILSVSRDITEQIEREDRLRERSQHTQKVASRLSQELASKKAELLNHDTIMREIDHRVKNSLASIVSMMRLQMRAITNEDARNALSDASNRVNAVSKVHEQLYAGASLNEVDLSFYLERLARDLHAAMAASDTALELSLEPLIVSIDHAVPIGMIVSELMGNAIRHGLADRGSGTLHISLTSEGDARSILSVRDNGKGLSKPYSRDAHALDPNANSGLGSKIIGLYLKQLNAELEVTSAPGEGTAVDMIFQSRP